MATLKRGDGVRVTDVRRLSERSKALIRRYKGIGRVRHVCLDRVRPEVCVDFDQQGLDSLWLTPHRLQLEEEM